MFPGVHIYIYTCIYIYKPSRQMGHLVYGRYFARHYSKKRNDRVNSTPEKSFIIWHILPPDDLFLHYHTKVYIHMYIPHHKKSPSPKSSQRRWLQDFVHFCFSLETRSAESFGARSTNIDNILHFWHHLVAFNL